MGMEAYYGLSINAYNPSTLATVYKTTLYSNPPSLEGSYSIPSVISPRLLSENGSVCVYYVKISALVKQTMTLEGGNTLSTVDMSNTNEVAKA